MTELKDLEVKIAAWETDIQLFIDACDGETYPYQNRMMNLIDMCPAALRKVLKEREHRLKDYSDIRSEIADWIAENGTPSRGRAAALEPKTPEDDGNGDDGEGDWDFDPDAMDVGELRALVRSKFTKKGGTPKGAGKGGGGGKGDHSTKECYECGKTGHIGADCPERKARVAAGGPERLPQRTQGIQRRRQVGSPSHQGLVEQLVPWSQSDPMELVVPRQGRWQGWQGRQPAAPGGQRDMAWVMGW